MHRVDAFFETIYLLRGEERLVLFLRDFERSLRNSKRIMAFLSEEYERETLDYPGVAPAFDSDAALWAAETVYFSAQMMLHYSETAPLIDKLCGAYRGTLTAGAMLSADLLLRFLPQIVSQLDSVDPEDPLVKRLLEHLRIFHYSGIGCAQLSEAELDFTWLRPDECLGRLYLDRVWERRSVADALRPELEPLLRADYGDYAKTLWPEYVLARNET